MIKINISKDYTRTPGGRYIKQGKFSGEDFREKYLIPKFEEATQKSEKLVINLDGVFGYSTSFLEEAFGGLARKYPDKDFSLIHLECSDNPTWVRDIHEYIKNAKEEMEKLK